MSTMFENLIRPEYSDIVLNFAEFSWVNERPIKQSIVTVQQEETPNKNGTFTHHNEASPEEDNHVQQMSQTCREHPIPRPEIRILP